MLAFDDMDFIFDHLNCQRQRVLEAIGNSRVFDRKGKDEFFMGLNTLDRNQTTMTERLTSVHTFCK
jgi:hypothetical protein